MASDAQSRIPAVLSIGGSDSGGGAGIQADLKAFARCGVHGMSAITAITWQNTVSVEGVTAVPAEAIVGQVRAVASDIGVDATKVGMLGSVDTIAAVEQALDLVGEAPIVIDPVMIAESGARLLDVDAVERLIALLGRATVVTPNVAEARALVEASGGDARVPVDSLVRLVGGLGPRFVVVTGGHIEGDRAIDSFWDGERSVAIAGPRYPAGAAHGSGCTHSSALAAQLALGLDPLEAARVAQRIASDAVRDGLHGIGAGAGPVDVFGLA